MKVLNFTLVRIPSQLKLNAQRFIVETESGKMIETDYVLDATGRKPNVQQIGLEKVGIQFSDRGIEVDDYLRTNVKIYTQVGTLSIK